MFMRGSGMIPPSPFPFSCIRVCSRDAQVWIRSDPSISISPLLYSLFSPGMPRCGSGVIFVFPSPAFPVYSRNVQVWVKGNLSIIIFPSPVSMFGPGCGSDLIPPSLFPLSCIPLFSPGVLRYGSDGFPPSQFPLPYIHVFSRCGSDVIPPSPFFPSPVSMFGPGRGSDTTPPSLFHPLHFFPRTKPISRLFSPLLCIKTGAFPVDPPEKNSRIPALPFPSPSLPPSLG